MSDTTDRLAAARAAKEAKEIAAREAAAARELEVLELDGRLEQELGPRGAYFEIVETLEGPIAVKLGEAVLHTRFQASKIQDADVHEYVFPNVVHPSKEKYLEIVGRRPGVALRCANALATLYGAKANGEAGKF
ncbi:MAG: hypothetical protein KF795_00285 [Labilithrix sp.]|nr:hypothetical protein [Labilithrix sp.]